MTSPRPSNFLIEPTGEHRAVVSEATEVGYVRAMRASSTDDFLDDERWILEHPEVIGAIRQGRAQYARGEWVDRGSFAEYADDTDADG